MLLYVLRRIIQAIPLLFLVIVVMFCMIHLAPGDPVSLFIQGAPGATPEFVQQMRESLGLDKPIGVQLVRYLGRVVQLDLGYSFFYQQRVDRMIAERLPLTLLLVAIATVVASVAGVALGSLAAAHPYSAIDVLNTVIAVVGYSIPVFWLSQLLIIVFSMSLHVFPTGGVPFRALGGVGLLDWTRYLTLPVISLAVLQLALVTRVARAAMLETLGTEYVKAARARGLAERTILWKHALRNAFLPVLTVITLNFSFQIGGALLVETIYSLPGMGRMMLDSLLRRDYPVLVGMLIVLSAIVMLVNLITDILYALLDPRIVYT